jgi:hypothetical protein
MLPIAALFLLLQDPGQGVVKVNPFQSPEAVVRRHVDAYNAKDMNALLGTLDLDVKLWAFPSRLQVQGKTDCANVWKSSFQASPELKMEVTERMVAGSHVIDHEWIKGRADGKILRGVSIYEVKNGFIVGIWFMED